VRLTHAEKRETEPPGKCQMTRFACKIYDLVKVSTSATNLSLLQAAIRNAIKHYAKHHYISSDDDKKDFHF